MIYNPDMEERSDARRIDLDTWERREAYDLFRGFGFPYFGITADIDVTALKRLPKSISRSFSIGLYYLLARAANEIPAFRQRMRDDGVVEYPVVDPAVTILGRQDQFRFCTLRYDPSFGTFAAHAEDQIERAKTAGSLWSEPDREDMLFMTCLPWVSFTAVLHPAPLHAPDSVPRIAWGKYVEKDERVKMPPQHPSPSCRGRRDSRRKVLSARADATRRCRNAAGALIAPREPGSGNLLSGESL